VAEIRPVEAARSDLEGELDTLASRGILVRPAGRRAKLALGKRRRGALARFLADRE
jgi:hypothetical protein